MLDQPQALVAQGYHAQQPLVLNAVLEPPKSTTPSRVSRTKQPKMLPLVTSTPTLVTCSNCKAVLDTSSLVNKNVKTALVCSVCHSPFHAMQRCRLDTRHIRGRELDHSTIEVPDDGLEIDEREIKDSEAEEAQQHSGRS
eukprot:3799864-Rhodomonas_salina.1